MCDYKQRSSYPRELITGIASGHNHFGLGILVSTLRAGPSIFLLLAIRKYFKLLGRSKGLCSQGNQSRELYQTVRTSLYSVGIQRYRMMIIPVCSLWFNFPNSSLVRILLTKQNFQTRHTEIIPLSWQNENAIIIAS